MRLSTILQPLTVTPWGALAMWYLGVPIAVGVRMCTFDKIIVNPSVFLLTILLFLQAPMVVVQDNDYTAAIDKLESAGFAQTSPNRAPPPEIMEDHPNPQQMLEELNAGYKRLDRSCALFDYPHGDPAEKGLQVYLFPNSFTHLSLEDLPRPSTEIRYTATTNQFETYGNLHYPLEQALVESFVKAAIDEEKDAGFSAWSESLRSWVSLMTGYLEVDNDVLDHCLDKQAVEWYSTNFGRIHEAKFGPIDRRVSKRSVQEKSCQ